MQHATFTMPSLSALDGDVESWQTGQAPTELIHLKKTGPGTENDEEGILDLNQVLQYGLSNGFPQFVSQLTELNELVHGKTIADASVYVSCGNTDGKWAWLGPGIVLIQYTGVSKVFQLFVEPVSRARATGLTEGRRYGVDRGIHLWFVAQFGPLKRRKVLPHQNRL
jgi:aromatic amino acid aminotransferase I